MEVALGFVLAAGLGTRLRPLSERVPKPLWPLFDRSLAARALDLLAEVGCEQAVVNLHHLPGALRSGLEDQIPRGLGIRWSLEGEILGTGGALGPWKGLLGDGPFFLLNGDTYQEIDLEALGAFHSARSAVATLSVRPAVEGGPIEVGPDGRIVRFLDARAPGCEAGRPCEFTGIHLLEPAVLDRLPAGPCCINRDVHRRLVEDGAPLYGFISSDDRFWSDLGTPGRYVSAHGELLRTGRVPSAPGRVWHEDGVTPEGGRVRASSYLGPGVRVEAGATVGPFTSVGHGAHIKGGACLSRCVVWPCAEVVGGRSTGGFFGPDGEFHPADEGP